MQDFSVICTSAIGVQGCCTLPTFSLSRNLQYTYSASRRFIIDNRRGQSSLSANVVRGKFFVSKSSLSTSPAISLGFTPANTYYICQKSKCLSWCIIVLYEVVVTGTPKLLRPWPRVGYNQFPHSSNQHLSGYENFNFSCMDANQIL